MRLLLLPISALLCLTFLSCATSEPAGADDDSQREVISEPSRPGWYDETVISSRDSLLFTGYSHSVSTNRTEAEELSTEMAGVNLLFEIDRFAEQVRRELSENSGNSTFGTAAFITSLRNAVQSVELAEAKSETEFFDKDAVTNAFTRMTLTADQVAEQLSKNINNRDFIMALRDKSGF